MTDPMFSAEELAAKKLTPLPEGETVDAIIVQADHPEFKELKASDFPGVQAIVDGRHMTDPANWDGVKHFVIGNGEA